MPSENITLPFCNHFTIIPSRLVCQGCTHYPGVKHEQFEDGKKKSWIGQVLTSSKQLNGSFHAVDRTRTTGKYAQMKALVESVRKKCFSSLNKQICVFEACGFV